MRLNLKKPAGMCWDLKSPDTSVKTLAKSYNVAMTDTELSLPEKLSGIHLHFVGIKGTGMAA